MSLGFSQRDLEALDRRVEEALAAGEPGDLEVLGWGEVSSVVAFDTPRGKYACKRLPLFPDRERFAAYKDCFGMYLDRLEGAGIRVVETELREVGKDDGRVVGYCIQPVVDQDGLVHRILARCDEPEALKWFDAICDRILAFVTDTFGLDAQFSNWAVTGGTLSYLDVTTPLVRDAGGKPVLDVDLFLAAIPRALRWPVKRFMLMEIVAKYCRPRDVIVDLLANLVKERLERWIPVFVNRANTRVEPAITEKEVRKYYRSDARAWALLLALRRVDRFFYMKILRKPYPFLLPGKIERNV